MTVEKVSYVLECFMCNTPKVAAIWRMKDGKPESCVLDFQKININTYGATQIVDILNQHEQLVEGY